jgi:hypothetical protein
MLAPERATSATSVLESVPVATAARESAAPAVETLIPKAIDSAMEVTEAASKFCLLVLAWNRESHLCVCVSDDNDQERA